MVLELIIKNLVKKFGDVVAVDDLSLEVKEREFVSLLGPSGCGKTTTLRCIAGLEVPDEGEILINQKVVCSVRDGIFVPPERRRLGMVFQSFAIWPHMTIFDNVAYGLRARGTPKKEVKEKVEKALELVGLHGLSQRYATQLSGGQQQRVCIARSLVYEPEMLLLDEPMSNLDASLRERLRIEVREIQRKIGITTIYVTHDQEEAMSLSDRIVVMNMGKIIQVGTPFQLYGAPDDTFTAVFFGVGILLPAVIIGRSNRHPRCYSAKLDLPADELQVRSNKSFKRGDKIAVGIRPEKVVLHMSKQEGKINVFECEVLRVVFQGKYTEVFVSCNNHIIRKREFGVSRLRKGTKLFVELPPQSCFIVPRTD